MTEIIAETELDSLVDYDSPVPCNHSGHGNDVYHHEGDASWLLSVECPACGYTTLRAPRCDRFLKSVMGANLGMICEACSVITLFRDNIIGLEHL